MATRVLTIDQMRAETTKMEEQVVIIEQALTKLNDNVRTSFKDAWNSNNSVIVEQKIDAMQRNLEIVKNKVRALKERIEAHAENVEKQNEVVGF